MSTSIITWPYVLLRGHGANPAEGACAMDAVNWLVHGRHGDAPECACPVISAYVISGNDKMPDDVRQRLLPYLHRIAGSRSAAHKAARIRILVLGAVRIFAPRALEAAGQDKQVAILRSVPDDAGYTEMRKLAKAAAWEAEAAALAAWAAAAWEAKEAAAWAAAWAALAAWAAAAWDDYFVVLDQALNAGPQGEPWSTDIRDIGIAAYRNAGGMVSVG